MTRYLAATLADIRAVMTDRPRPSLATLASKLGGYGQDSDCDLSGQYPPARAGRLTPSLSSQKGPRAKRHTRDLPRSRRRETEFTRAACHRLTAAVQALSSVWVGPSELSGGPGRCRPVYRSPRC